MIGSELAGEALSYMNDLHTPLSQRELDSLDELLLNRPGLEDSGGDTDEGIIGVSELDDG